jgi:hypothetical protein
MIKAATGKILTATAPVPFSPDDEDDEADPTEIR